jgi:Reverse transcriptase (RNA-dependent DNA polymerase)
MRENYRYSYKRRDKQIFVPSPECERRGDYLIAWGETLALPPYFYHYRKGGHVDALHRHLANIHFFRIDLKNFFYSISRNRVSRVLRQYGFPRSARVYAEWSTVRNPYPSGSRYVLPIGFRQSPLVASLALHRSSVASAVEDALARGVFVSVYFDDLIGSSADPAELQVTYDGILAACIQANLIANTDKLLPPAKAITAFNCDLRHGFAAVTAARIKKFEDENPSPKAVSSFLAYCYRVEKMNRPAGAP